MRLLIADDLTGSCDAGVPFARRGIKSLVAFSPASLKNGLPEVGLLAVNTASRNIPVADAAHAAASTAQLLQSAAKEKPSLVFKKIDSAMRGNIGAETDAIMAAFGFDAVFLTPAYPAQGRAVIDGDILINGAPITETEFARDPLAPTREAAASKIIAAQSRARIADIALADIRAGFAAAQAKVGSLLAQGFNYLVFDAKDNCDLELVAKMGMALPKRPLFAGSAGLAEALAALEPAAATVMPLCGDRIFFVCGSASKAAHAQVEALVQTGVPLVRASRAFRREREALAAKALEMLKKGSVILAAPLERMDSQEDCAAISFTIAAIGALAAARAREAGISFALCLTGGETAFAFLKSIADFMLLHDEPRPGVALASIYGGEWNDVSVITKAGGFGGARTLVDVMNICLAQK